MAKSRQGEGDDNRDHKSRAGRNRKRSPARRSTVNLMIQIVRLLIEVLDVLGR